MTFPKAKIWKCHFFVVPLHSISDYTEAQLKEKKVMKAKWSGLVDDMKGHVDKDFYARHIPGNGTWAAVCHKPELSKEEKKKRAAHPTAKQFSNYIAESKAILQDPERRAAWQAKYDETLYRARKWGKPAYGRLCDYVRHEVSEMLKRGEEIKP